MTNNQGQPEGPRQLTLEEIDADDNLLPEFQWIPLPTFWRFENFRTTPDGKPAVCVIVANAAFPKGMAFSLDRERGMLFVSQLKKRLQTGPQLEVPPASGQLLVPG